MEDAKILQPFLTAFTNCSEAVETARATLVDFAPG
jgi:hypothetical protein